LTKDNLIQTKSYNFALAIVSLYLYLKSEKREFELGRQLLRSGTSIGANVEEAIGAHSKRNFHYKISIAYKEARETLYWLRILRDSEILSEAMATPLIEECTKLLKILGSIQKTLADQSRNP